MLILRSVVVTFFVLASDAALARDINTIALSLQHYTTQCQQLYQDYAGYVSRLPERNPSGDPTSTVSPDGRAITIYLEVDGGYLEAMIDVLSERVVQHCAYYAELETSWDTNAIASQYVQWLSQSSTLEVVGGHSPIYGYDHYRHTILGAWPAYNIEIQTNIHQNEFQVLSTRILQKQK
ncbi:MAG: hypothetical protein AAGA74_04915 [Pseudomonadota bacterium]